MTEREKQLETENAVLKERLYACHATGHPEVIAALAPHVDLMALDVYQERAQLRQDLRDREIDLARMTGNLRAMEGDRDLQRGIAQHFEALALQLWAQLGHDVTKEPLPELVK